MGKCREALLPAVSCTNYRLIGRRWELVHWSGSQHVIVQHAACGLIFIFHDQLRELNIAQGSLEPFLAYLQEFKIHFGLFYSVLCQDKPQKRFRLCLKQHLLVSNFWNRCIHAFITCFTMEVSASSQTQSGPCSRLLMSVSGEERTTVRCCSTRHT